MQQRWLILIVSFLIVILFIAGCSSYIGQEARGQKVASPSQLAAAPPVITLIY